MLRRHRKPDALQGTLDLLVLKTLSCGPHHGYGIAADIQSISDDILRVEEGSLYPALHRMEHLGWITAEWQMTENNRRARLYKLTRAGQRRLDEEQLKWDRLMKAVGKVLRFA
ncbi:MAG: PadR family transcriptional regulator [Acidobacteria bacterium]|nr:PadR family transcriptional regulator [Acidobacteriota bacterium]